MADDSIEHYMQCRPLNSVVDRLVEPAQNTHCKVAGFFGGDAADALIPLLLNDKLLRRPLPNLLVILGVS